MTCPICQRGGLSAGTQSCPQCNSDLSSFSIIDKIETRLIARRKVMLVSGVSALVMVIVVVAFIRNRELRIETLASHDEPTKIDSVPYYRNRLNTLLIEVDSLKRKSIFVINYKVRPGDNLSRIAYLFYSDVNKADKIAKDNRLKNPDLIKVGEILKVKIDP